MESVKKPENQLKERLTAVPFARYSLEGQVEYEKNMRRKTERTVGGIFTEY